MGPTTIIARLGLSPSRAAVPVVSARKLSPRSVVERSIPLRRHPPARLLPEKPTAVDGCRQCADAPLRASHSHRARPCRPPRVGEPGETPQAERIGRSGERLEREQSRHAAESGVLDSDPRQDHEVLEVLCHLQQRSAGLPSMTRGTQAMALAPSHTNITAHASAQSPSTLT